MRKPESSSTLPPSAHTIFQLDDTGTWMENIAVRSSGALLTTLMWPEPSLYQVSEPWSDSPGAELLYTFPGVGNLLGIAEFAPDVFAIAAGNLTADSVGIPDSFSIWEVDFNQGSYATAGALPFTVRKITDIPDALFLNGVATIPAVGSAGPVILICDSTLGLVFRVDPRTGSHAVALQEPEMAPIAGATPLIGINGIKYADGYLYFDNSFATTIYRIDIAADGSGPASPESSVETVAVVGDAPFLDDFTFGPGGSTSDIWVTTHPGNTIERVDVATGESLVVAGSSASLTIAGCTAAEFGRTPHDWDTLYVVTDGGTVAPVNGTITEPAKVVAVDTSSLA
ncbi:hypothetical protein BX600DRAFT_510261 [Xylariales sp. PMI_506]|nr:hypothetical protein BX600DRAFT_510261 [Xylariales sp. PMI_506]